MVLPSAYFSLASVRLIALELPQFDNRTIGNLSREIPRVLAAAAVMFAGTSKHDGDLNLSRRTR